MPKVLNVPTEGTWVALDNGVVTFTPKATFKDTPTPIHYTVENSEGVKSQPASLSANYAEVLNAHVFIVAGQSNAAGTAANVLNRSFASNVYQIARETSLTGNRDLSLATMQTRTLDNYKTNSNTGDITAVEGRPNLQMSFVDGYIADNPGVPIVLIPCAMGGSAINYGLDQWGVGNTLQNETIARVNAVMSANPTWELKALLWHQGESNAGSGATAASWTIDVMNDFRAKITGATNLPIILGEWVKAWTDADAARITAMEAYRQIPASLSNSYLASSSSPTILTPDLAGGVHFGDQGYKDLGERYYKGYKRFSQREAGATKHFIFGADNQARADISSGSGCTVTDTSALVFADNSVKTGVAANQTLNVNAGTFEHTFSLVVTIENPGASFILSNRTAPYGSFLFVNASGEIAHNNPDGVGYKTVGPTSFYNVGDTLQVIVSYGAAINYKTYNLTQNTEFTPTPAALDPAYIAAGQDTNFRLGNPGFSTTTYPTAPKFKEFILWDTTLSLAEFDNIKARSAARLV